MSLVFVHCRKQLFIFMRHVTLPVLLALLILSGCGGESGENAADERNRDTTDVEVDTTRRYDTTGAARPPAGSDAGTSPEGSDRSLPRETEAGSGLVKLYPVDEAAEDPSFFDYRMQLLEAIVRRDADALLGRVAEDIRISFGPNGGRDAFREQWNPSEPESPLWSTMARVVAGGGLFLDREYLAEGVEATFQAPYYFAAFPGERFDAFQHAVVIRDDVVVRAHPDPGAPETARLSFDIVGVAGSSPVGMSSDRRWARVVLADGREGYVAEDAIASPIGYRAVFQKRGGRWSMNAFVAGD